MTLAISFYDGIKYPRTAFIDRDLDFFGNGVVATSDFPVTFPSTPNMTINVGQGRAWVDGYRVSNDATTVMLTVAAADPTYPRIDIIQIGHDDINSQPSLVVKQGVAQTNPVEPGADPGYTKLWAINVPAGATSITNSNMIDRRALVPLNVNGSQINFGGAASTSAANTFTQAQTAPEWISTNANAPLQIPNLAAAPTGASTEGTVAIAKINGVPSWYQYTGGQWQSMIPGNVAKTDAIQTWTANQTFDASIQGKYNTLDDSTGIASIYKQLNGLTGAQFSMTPISQVTGLTVTVGTSGAVGANLAANTNYYYVVTPIDVNGKEGIAQDPVHVTTGATAYPITASWTALSGASSYNVYRGTTNTDVRSYKYITNVTTASYVDDGNTAPNTARVTPGMNNSAQMNVGSLTIENIGFILQDHTYTDANGGNKSGGIDYLYNAFPSNNNSYWTQIDGSKVSMLIRQDSTGNTEFWSAPPNGTNNGQINNWQNQAQMGADGSFKTNPVSPPTSPTATVGTSGAVGANLVANTTYNYTVTALAWDVSNNTQETNASSTASATTGATAYPITISWSGQPAGARYLNIYKNGHFLAQIPGYQTSYTDNGNTATTSQTPPSRNLTGAAVFGADFTVKGILQTNNNTLDDGGGNASFSGNITPRGGYIRVSGLDNQNLLFNSTAAYGLTGWSATAHASDWSANAFNGVNDGTYFHNDGASAAASALISQYIGISSSGTYTLSGWVFNGGSSNNISGFNIRYYDQNHNQLSENGFNANAGVGWTYGSVTAQAPSNAWYAAVSLDTNNTATNANIAWARLKFEGGPLATPYTNEGDINPEQYGSLVAQGLGAPSIVAQATGVTITTNPQTVITYAVPTTGFYQISGVQYNNNSLNMTIQYTDGASGVQSQPIPFGSTSQSGYGQGMYPDHTVYAKAGTNIVVGTNASNSGEVSFEITQL